MPIAMVATAEDTADQVVKRVSEEVLQIVRTDPKVQAGDMARIREVVDSKVAPHFDFERMTALAMGKNWRAATAEQKKQLSEQFELLLVRTYAGAVNRYREHPINYKPTRDPNATDVVVRTEVQRQGQQPINIDYSMENKDGRWLAYDVIVEGVSLVTNYRDEFNTQVQQGGIDSLIKTLAAKNTQGPAK
jgi:phospholipid transport system substrate-binding protein